jgi:hypothetical protein
VVAFARDASAEPAWIGSLSSEAARQAVAMLSARHKQTVEAHYFRPVPLLTVLDGYERFGNDGLPDDPLRPGDPRRNMRDPVTWFSSSAFAEACVRLGIWPGFWLLSMRAILCGLLNDGLFRGRFPVQGFAATPQGRLAVFQHAQDVADAELPGELRRRFVESRLRALTRATPAGMGWSGARIPGDFAVPGIRQDQEASCAGTIWSTAPTLLTWPAVSVTSVGSISASGWAGAVAKFRGSLHQGFTASRTTDLASVINSCEDRPGLFPHGDGRATGESTSSKPRS